MKELEKFEKKLLDCQEGLKPTLESVINNMGRIIALICAVVTLLVTFTDITFAELGSANTLPTLTVLLLSSYIIYFSLEDSGEKLGERSDEYIAAKERYTRLRAKIGGEDIGNLRDFLEVYRKEELDYRRKRLLLGYGLSEDELSSYSDGERFPRGKARALRRISRQKPINLSTETLLGGIHRERGGTLDSPSKSKFPRLLIKLIPSTLCMTVTVSVILSVKSDMGVSEVISALLKLSALPVVGFRGYSAGYSYAKNTLPVWLNARADIIESFIKEREQAEIK